MKRRAPSPRLPTPYSPGSDVTCASTPAVRVVSQVVDVGVVEGRLFKRVSGRGGAGTEAVRSRGTVSVQREPAASAADKPRIPTRTQAGSETQPRPRALG